MASNSILFVIWCDGSIINSPRGVEYLGGRYVHVPINGRINFGELAEICRTAVSTSVSPREVTKIYFRLPHVERYEICSYSLFEVQDDQHVFAILNQTARMPTLNVLEFYVEYHISASNETSMQLDLCSSESERGSVEEEEDEHYDSEEEDMEDILIAEEPSYITHYQSRLPQHIRCVDLSDFDVDETWEAPNIEWQRGMEFQTGMIFSSRLAVRTCAITYSVDNGREFKSHRTTKTTLVLVCKHREMCNWWLRATLLQKTNTWALTKYRGPHKCDMLASTRNHRNFGIIQIADFIKSQVLGQRDIRIKTLMAGILESLGLALPYKRVWYGKERAISSVYGDWEYNYTQITKFMDNVVQVNPGSFWHGEGRLTDCSGVQCRIFKRMFWTFFPMVDGFPFCKPILFIDGTHLYGKYKLHMLIASAVDGNNHIMPVAFAIVESESSESFEYFLNHLGDQVIRDRKVAIVSDRAPGLISVLRRPEWEGIDHFFCIRHLMANFHTHIRNNDMKLLDEKAGRTFQEKKYKRYMATMAIRSPAGYAYLTDERYLKKEQWALCWDIKAQRNGVMTTNYAESINATLKNVRGLPITAMIEAIFDRLSDMFVKRWEMYKGIIAQGVMFTLICNTHMKNATLKARTHKLKKYNPDTLTYRVITKKDNFRRKGGNIQKVNLQMMKCTCGKFQHRQIHCSHAMAVIQQEKLNPHNYVGWRYQTKNAIQAWNTQFNQLPTDEMWIGSREVPFITDINLIRKKGRPVDFHGDTEDFVRQYYGSTTYYGSTSAQTQCPPAASFSVPPTDPLPAQDDFFGDTEDFIRRYPASSFTVPPASVPYVGPSFGQADYITPLATPPPQFSQHPAFAFTPFQATQTAQTPPPQTPTYLPTVPVFDDSWNFSSLTTPPSQRSRLMEEGYIPMLPGQDPGSSSRPTQSPSHMHFSLDDPWIYNLVQDPQPFSDF
ncbi:uncharacterized protein LOC126661647 [Mercurialis annua]|uniref:uncharacterized protein LOC126661647 n=1 Tax=Mercurialis annua TaxID=3986 RepID=UPI0024AF01C2|nr:uncharacterized protein LOC126661647 [Mercurialis annua]